MRLSLGDTNDVSVRIPPGAQNGQTLRPGGMGGPGHGAPMMVYRQIEFARMHLLGNLTVDMDLDMTALGVITSRIDHQHPRRQDLSTLARAVAAKPTDVRARGGAFVLASVG